MEDLYTKEERREHLLSDAKKEIARLKAMKLLIAADDDCEAVLRIDGSIKHAFSHSTLFLSAIDMEIKEIKKAIAGKPNKWA